MDSVLQDIDCDFVYLDDILIASSSEKEHLEDLRIVFPCLTKQGLEKCLFWSSLSGILWASIV